MLSFKLLQNNLTCFLVTLLTQNENSLGNKNCFMISNKLQIYLFRLSFIKSLKVFCFTLK